MKRLLLLIFFVTTFGFIGYGQQFDIVCNIDTTHTVGSKGIAITIEVIGGAPDFKAFIYDGFPGKDGNIIAIGEKIGERKFRFSDVTINKYYIGVLDKNQKFVCKSNSQMKSLQ